MGRWQGSAAAGAALSCLAAAGAMLGIAAPTRTQTTEACAALSADALTLAPPVGQMFLYQVRVGRPNRHGAMDHVAFVYHLQWDRLGRGYRLASRLTAIRTDADSDYGREIRRLMSPLMNEPVSFAVDPHQNRVTLMDGNLLWDRLFRRAATTAADSIGHPNAQLLGNSLLDLPTAAREQLLTADISALTLFAGRPVTPELAAPLRAAGPACGPVELVQTDPGDDRVDNRAGGSAAAPQFTVYRRRTLDLRTGLIIAETEQSWTTGTAQTPPVMVSERHRTLTPLIPDP